MIPTSGTYADQRGRIRYLQRRSDGYFYYYNHERGTYACYSQKAVRTFTFLCLDYNPDYVRTRFPEHFL